MSFESNFESNAFMLFSGRSTVFDRLEKLDGISDFARIRCPQCSWRPLKESRWHCASTGAPEFYARGCGKIWNTFETRGKCPGCSHQWRWTTCLSCGKDSLHDDWYESN